MKNRSMIEIHTAVFLFGVAGLFGKFLDLSPMIIVFGRTFFATLILSAILGYRRTGLRPRSRRDLAILILLGTILAVHWVTFFHSIQISTVAIGLLTYSTFPLFVTFMEPYLFAERLRRVDVITAVIILMGLILVIPSFDFRNNITQGVLWGTLSGFTFAILSLLNRKYVRDYSAQVIAWYQNGIAALVLLPFVGVTGIVEVNGREFLLLAILGIFCTALAHALFISSLSQIKTQLASLIASLEPVYGILFALLLLGEIPSLRTLLGGGIILGTIAYASTQRA